MARQKQTNLVHGGETVMTVEATSHRDNGRVIATFLQISFTADLH